MGDLFIDSSLNGGLGEPLVYRYLLSNLLYSKLPKTHVPSWTVSINKAGTSFRSKLCSRLLRKPTQIRDGVDLC